MRHLTYDALLYSNGVYLDSNYVRRLHFDLLICYRIVFGSVSAKREDIFECAAVTTAEDMHINYLSPDVPVLFVVISLPSVLLISGLNNLPSTVNFASLTTFGQTIAVVDLSNYFNKVVYFIFFVFFHRPIFTGGCQCPVFCYA